MSVNSLSQWGITALLFAVLGGLIWHNYAAQTPAAQAAPPPFDQRFTDFTARAFNPEGALSWTFTGASLRHLANDQGYAFVAPDFLLQARNPNTPPWRLTAPTGTANENLSTVLLQGGVHGQRAAAQTTAATESQKASKSTTQGELTFKTEALTIKPRQQVAQSTDSSQFAELDRKNQPLWISESTGFHLDYAQNIFKQTAVRDQYNRPAMVQNTAPSHRTNPPSAVGAQP